MMSMEPRFEIGVDYDGVSPRHQQVNEVVMFANDDLNRIFMPEYGAFFTDTLVIKNAVNDVPLILGTDYNLAILDPVATERSGREVCGIIDVFNKDIQGVTIDYRYIGGLHMTGYYLLEHILKMFPNGIKSVIDYNDIINIPDEVDPAYHTQHLKEFFKTESLLVSLERLHQAIVLRYEEHLRIMYKDAEAEMDDLYQLIKDQYAQILSDIKDTFNKLKIRPDEYIFTDSPEDPAIKRKYGIWRLVTDAVLANNADSRIGGNFSNVGSLANLGRGNLLRNCYIWRNIENQLYPECNIAITADKETVNEGETITFIVKLRVAGAIPSAQRWNVIDKNTKNKPLVTDFNTVGGLLNINAITGIGTVTLTAAKDLTTEGLKAYRFMLTSFPKNYCDFLVADTSPASKIKSAQFYIYDKATTLVGEDISFYLKVEATADVTRAYIKWDLTDSLKEQLLDPLPAYIDVLNGVGSAQILFIGDKVANLDTRIIKAQVSETTDFPALPESHPLKASAYVADTSKPILGSFLFHNGDMQPLSITDEGSKFKIRLTTNAGANKVINFTFSSTKPLTEFIGLKDKIITNSEGFTEFEVQCLEDFQTAGINQSLTVSASYGGVEISKATLNINDNSLTPVFEYGFSTTDDGSELITKIDEGENFFYTIKVANWKGSSNPMYLSLQALGLGDIPFSQRVEVPDIEGDITFDGNNGKGYRFVNGNTLAIELRSIADLALKGDYTFSMAHKLKTSPNGFMAKSIIINDTSAPVVTAQWSSSNTELKLITEVSELNPTGTPDNHDGIAYLWVDVIGEGQTYINPRLVLDPTSEATLDDVVFDPKLEFTVEKTRNIIPVTFKADFITEGNQLLKLIGRADNYKPNFCETSILIKDTAFRMILSGKFTKLPLPEKFSEWEPLDTAITFDVMSFATTLKVTAKNKTTGVVIDTHEINIPATRTTVNDSFKLNPNREENGDYEVELTYVRVIKDKVISDPLVMTAKVMNDKLKPTIRSWVEDPDGKVVTTVDEGVTYSIFSEIKDPYLNTAALGAFMRRGATVDGDVGSDDPMYVLTMDKYVYNVNTVEKKNNVIKLGQALMVKLDRETNVPPKKVRLVAIADWSKAWEGGSVFDLDVGVETSSSLRSYITLDVNDTSKSTSMIYKILDVDGNEKTNFNEGETVTIEVALTNPKLNQSYSLVIDPATNAPLGRFSSHDFGTKHETIINQDHQVITFSATITENYKTDGDVKLGFVLVNDTTGQHYKDWGSIIIVDSSKAFEMTTKLLKGDAVTTAMNDGDTGYFIRVEAPLSHAGKTVKLERTGGRELTDLESHDFGKELPLVVGSNVSYADFKVNWKKIHRTDAVNTLNTLATFTLAPDNKVESSFKVNDQYRKLELIAKWVPTNNVNGSVDSVDEGASVYLSIVANGGDVDLDVEILENGGRSKANMLSNGYTTYKRSADGRRLFQFTPTKDKTNNTGKDLFIRAKIRFKDHPDVFVDTELPINDTSTATTGSIVLMEDSVNKPIVNYVEEGRKYIARFYLTNPKLNVERYRVKVKNTGHAGVNLDTSIVLKATNDTTVNPAFLPLNSILVDYFYEVKFEIPDDNILNPESALKLDLEIFDTLANEAIVTRPMTIFDMETVEKTYSLKLTKVGWPITEINEGENGTITFDCTGYTGDAYIDFVGDSAGRMLIGGSVPPYKFNITSKRGGGISAPLSVLIDETTNVNPNVKVVVLDANKHELVSADLKVNDVYKTPEITAHYFAKDPAGLTPIVNFPIVPETLVDSTVYLITKTKNCLVDRGKLTITFPRNKLTQDGWIENVDLKEGDVEKTLNGTLVSFDEETKEGVYTTKLIFRPKPPVAATANGIYNYYQPIGDFILEPNAVKKVVIVSPLVYRDDETTNTGSAGITGFYIQENNSNFELASNSKDYSNLWQGLSSNNHALQPSHLDIPIEWVSRNAKAFYLLRGPSGYNGTTFIPIDVEQTTLRWGGVNIHGYLDSTNSQIGDASSFGAEVPSFNKVVLNQDGIELCVLSTETIFNYQWISGAKAFISTLLIRNTTNSRKVLKTTHGRPSITRNTLRANFGADTGEPSGDFGGSITIMNGTWLTDAIETPKSAYASLTNRGYTGLFTPMVGGGGFDNDGYAIKAGLTYTDELDKLEFLLSGDTTATPIQISRGRCEGLISVTGTFDSESNITTYVVPIVPKMRVIGIRNALFGSENSVTLSGKVKMTLKDGTTFTSKELSGVSYTRTEDINPMYPAL